MPARKHVSRMTNGGDTARLTVGFFGHRGPTVPPGQLESIRRLLAALRPAALIHRDRVGCDAAAHTAARDELAGACQLTVAPADDTMTRAFRKGENAWRELPIRDQTRAIVRHLDVDQGLAVIAPHKWPEWPGGSTWEAARLCRAARVPALLVAPSGRIVPLTRERL